MIVLLNRLKKQKLAISLACSAIALCVFALAAYSTYNYEVENQKRMALNEIATVSKELENLINNQLYRSMGLSAYYIQNSETSADQLHRYADVLYGDFHSVLRSVALLKDTTIFFVHPLRGNEAAIGVDLSQNPTQKYSVSRVKAEQLTIVDAPVDLVQGGRGIIIRVPVVSHNPANTTQYLGQMSVVLDYDLLLSNSKLDDLMNDYHLQLVDRQRDGSKKVIYANVGDEPVGAYTYELNLPNLDWAIVYLPAEGWKGSSLMLYWIVFLGFGISGLIGYMVYKQFSEKDALNNLVDERTRALIQTNDYLEQTLAEVEEKQAELFLVNDQLEESLEHLKDTQEQLIQSEKFAALGELVAGVAHEINTPLGIGITLATFVEDKHQRIAKLFENGQLSKNELKEYNDAVSEALGVMVSSLNRSAEIISSFKNVAGEQSALELRHFKVRDYFEDVLQNLKPRLKKTPHEVVLLCDPELVIFHYPGAFSHLLTNFIVNSLVHGFTEETPGHMTIEFSKKENSCQLVYSDDGAGISSQHLTHIFDPFYTTKKGQGSTGLGLHIVHNIVTQNLNGKISLVTSEGHGVRFTIDFPLLNPEDFHEQL